MKLNEIFAEKSCVFSIECFPPKQAENFEKLRATLRTMKELSPDFISVTYGAGGSAGGVSTVEIADFIKNDLQVEPMAHLVCMGNDRQSVDAVLKSLRSCGVENVLALRGDRTPLRPASKDFAHASDMAAYIAQTGPDFHISGACYPEGHPEAATLAEDIENLKIKQSAGATHLVTQLFFDNSRYYRFLNMTRKAGLTLPVSAGVMPIVRKSQIERTVELSSASLPPEFTKMISRYRDDAESLFQAGIEYAIVQLRDLIEGGADGVHLYAMNNAEVARQIYRGISDLL